MHQRKLHLLALCENDLLEPWLNSTLSLWVRRNSLQWIGAVCAERLSVSCLPHLSPVCLTKACSEAVWSGPLSRFPSSCLLPEPISKIESRCHLLTPCFLTKCVQFQNYCRPSSLSPGPDTWYPLILPEHTLSGLSLRYESWLQECEESSLRGWRCYPAYICDFEGH